MNTFNLLLALLAAIGQASVMTDDEVVAIVNDRCQTATLSQEECDRVKVALNSSPFNDLDVFHLLRDILVCNDSDRAQIQNFLQSKGVPKGADTLLASTEYFLSFAGPWMNTLKFSLGTNEDYRARDLLKVAHVRHKYKLPDAASFATFDAYFASLIAMPDEDRPKFEAIFKFNNDLWHINKAWYLARLHPGISAESALKAIRGFYQTGAQTGVNEFIKGYKVVENKKGDKGQATTGEMKPKIIDLDSAGQDAEDVIRENCRRAGVSPEECKASIQHMSKHNFEIMKSILRLIVGMRSEETINEVTKTFANESTADSTFTLSQEDKDVIKLMKNSKLKRIVEVAILRQHLGLEKHSVAEFLNFVLFAADGNQRGPVERILFRGMSEVDRNASWVHLKAHALTLMSMTKKDADKNVDLIRQFYEQKGTLVNQFIQEQTGSTINCAKGKCLLTLKDGRVTSFNVGITGLYAKPAAKKPRNNNAGYYGNNNGNNNSTNTGNSSTNTGNNSTNTGNNSTNTGNNSTNTGSTIGGSNNIGGSTGGSSSSGSNQSSSSSSGSNQSSSSSSGSNQSSSSSSGSNQSSSSSSGSNQSSSSSSGSNQSSGSSNSESSNPNNSSVKMSVNNVYLIAAMVFCLFY